MGVFTEAQELYIEKKSKQKMTAEHIIYKKNFQCFVHFCY